MLRPFLCVFALASALFAQSLFAQTTSGSANGDEASGSPASQQPTPKLLPAAMPSRREDPAAESELLAMANQSRRQAGVPPLRMNDDLMRAARSHARLMIDQRQLSHQFEGEPSLLKRLHETGVPLNSVAENVAYNYGAAQVFDSFMHSPPHRANLLDPDFNAAAFVAIWSDGKLYVVQDFIRQTADVMPASQRK
jgi:uncharacterized protein YkwD